jgi:hypothetical protein
MPVDQNYSPEAARWIAEIKAYEKEAGPWEQRSKKIVKRYKDERQNESDQARNKYNVLWSNLQTLMPAVFAKNPTPEVERRYKDEDPVGREASDLLERGLSFAIKEGNNFKGVMRSAVLDRFLCGRGIAWVRYVPHFRDEAVVGSSEVRNDGSQLTDDAGDSTDGKLDAMPDQAMTQVVDYEEVRVDYVHWQDFGHTAKARTWDEVSAVWRIVYLDKKQVAARFGDELAAVLPYSKSAATDDSNGSSNAPTKAIIYEIWDKSSHTAIWLCKDYPQSLLDKKADPLKLDGFFPCPKPMFATLANDSCIPVPDFAIYQDQADELDSLTARIAALTKALKVVGCYDASAAGVERMLSEGIENKLIPVKEWAAMQEKGGLEAAIQFLPIKEIAEVLMQLYDAREKVKQELYEITGMSDILRGANDPSETATSTRMKGQFASIRLRDMQDEVARFCRELVYIMGQVMAAHFSIETLLTISGAKLLSQQDKAMVQQMEQMGQQLPPAVLKQMADPSMEDVDAMLKNNAIRTFRIDIETDSTIGDDAETDQQQRMAFLESSSKFLQQAVPAAQENPMLAPLLGEMLMFGVRSFKVGRSLEGAFQATLDKLQQMASQPQPPKPDPEQVKAQASLQAIQAKAQADMQVEQVRAQTDIQIEQAKIKAQMGLEQFKANLQAQVAISAQQAQAQENAHQNALEAQREALQQQFEQHMEQTRLVLEQQRADADRNLQIILANLNNAARLEVAEVQAATTLQSAQISAAQAAESGEGPEDKD